MAHGHSASSAPKTRDLKSLVRLGGLIFLALAGLLAVALVGWDLAHPPRPTSEMVTVSGLGCATIAVEVEDGEYLVTADSGVVEGALLESHVTINGKKANHANPEATATPNNRVAIEDGNVNFCLAIQSQAVTTSLKTSPQRVSLTFEPV